MWDRLEHVLVSLTPTRITTACRKEVNDVMAALTSWPEACCAGRAERIRQAARIGDQVGLRLFKRSNNDFSTDGGKVVKKSLQRMTAFDVVDERLHNGRGALIGANISAFYVRPDSIGVIARLDRAIQ
jgi:hypothetical protein